MESHFLKHADIVHIVVHPSILHSKQILGKAMRHAVYGDEDDSDDETDPELEEVLRAFEAYDEWDWREAKLECSVGSRVRLNQLKAEQYRAHGATSSKFIGI